VGPVEASEEHVECQRRVGEHARAANR
jgi:hypothetical protein